MKFKTLKFERNKNKIIAGVISVIAAIGLAIIIGRSFAFDNDENYLKTQTVDGLTFEKANIEYNQGVSKFTVEVYNDTEEKYNLKNISIEITKENGETVQLIAYIGEVIEKEEVKYLQASIDQDLKNSIKINYSINK